MRGRFAVTLVLAGAFVSSMITSVPAQGDHTPAHNPALVINEVATRGPDVKKIKTERGDEFVEIRNRTGATVSLAGWTLRVCDVNAVIQTIPLPASASVTANSASGTATEFFVMFNAASYTGVRTGAQSSSFPDGSSNGVIPDDGGVALFDPAGSLVDGVGFISLGTSPCTEPAPAASQGDSSQGSNQRSRASVDTNNNSVDFAIRPRTPGLLNPDVPPGTSVQAIAHTGITVSDLDASVSFWRDALGFSIVGTGRFAGAQLETVIGVSPAAVNVVQLARNGQSIELLEYTSLSKRVTFMPRPVDVGSIHIGLSVDNIDAVVATCAAYGYLAKGPIQTISTGPLTGTRVTYVFGPDGTAIELLQYPVA